MIEKSLYKLEYHKILDMLADYAAFACSRELAYELKPASNPHQAAEHLAATEEAREILRLHPSFSLGPLWDIRPHLKHLNIGGILEPEALLQVAALCRAARLSRFAIGELKNHYPIISGLGRSLTVLKSIESAIEKAIGADNQVLDNASDRLGQIRRRMRVAAQRIKERLESIIRNASTNKYLQDALVTMREGRYVVPVKQEYRNQIPGVTHDVSTSGATLFIEPLAVLELNNELAALSREEESEIAAILRGLSLLISGFDAELNANLNLLTELDFILSKGKLSHAMNASSPKITNTGSLNLVAARHPLIPAKQVVPISVKLGKKHTSMIITGPNTGGKTVSLKTIGLLTLMALSGLHIPAEPESEIPCFNCVLADIGDEQSIEQSLSTFSSHMVNIVEILNIAKENSLVLLDELGAGTDPTEGAALAMAILASLQRRGVFLVATTHYSELKAFAYNRPGFINASVEFDVNTLSPTYRLLMGVPGKSNAFEISRRLGLQEELIEEAAAFLTQEDAQVADLLANLEELRRKVAQEREAAEKAAIVTKVRETKLHEEGKRLAAEKAKILHDSHEQAMRIVEDTLLHSKAVYQDMVAKAATEQEAAREYARAQKKLKDWRQQLEEELPQPVMDGEAPEKLSVGDYVYLPKLRQYGYVITAPENNEIGVQVGLLKLKLKTGDLRAAQPPEQRPAPRRVNHGQLGFAKAQALETELNLHGMDSMEALEALEKYLDDAFIAGIKTLRINHGRGTGVLRKAVRDHLRNHRLVKNYRQADNYEGGIGVTVVELDL
ncbi:MAG: endonuclease MutS2 [Firmicutes bacterium]|nr:endonuclease MutS2 [Bacillota bacterium]